LPNGWSEKKERAAMRNKLNKVALVLAGLFIAVISPAGAIAQSSAANQGLNIEISPLPIKLSAKPGTTTSTDLRVRNTGTTPETLKLSLKTFSAEGPDGHIVLKEPTPTDEFTKWVSFSKTEFVAPPGQWQTIKMTINLPKSAAYGYYYAVQFELANPPQPQPGAARLQGAVAIFVLLNAEAPGAKSKISVSSFKANHSTYEFLPVNFTVQVHNNGNVHTAPHGNIFIKKGSKQVAELHVNSTEGVVLPASNRIFKAQWTDGFPIYVPVTNAAGQTVKDKNGDIKTKLKWDFSKAAKLRFGHYTANLVLVYNDGQRDIPITGTLSFWVIPWRLIAIVFFLLLLIGGLLAYVIILRRRLKRTGPAYRSPKL
jgi:hypothetical protein